MRNCDGAFGVFSQRKVRYAENCRFAKAQNAPWPQRGHETSSGHRLLDKILNTRLLRCELPTETPHGLWVGGFVRLPREQWLGLVVGVIYPSIYT